MDWSKIDKIIYINLATRNDRKTQLLDDLKRLNAPEDKILRFEAIKHNLSYIGCALSHRNVLEICIENGWQRVMILEDDMQFTQDPSDIVRLENTLNLLDDIEWDVFFPSSNYFELSKTPYADDIVQVHSAYTTHCYIVNQNYFETLHRAVNQNIFQLLKFKQESDAIDVLYENLMKCDTWLGLYPMIGFQRSSYSDIRKGVVDYSSVYQDGILKRDIYWR